LICAGFALVLAILMMLPLMFKRRTPSPPTYGASLPQFVPVMANTAPRLAPRQLIVAALLIGAALALSGRKNGKMRQRWS
jgi:hypothetical protein